MSSVPARTHRFLAVAAAGLVAALMGATLAAGHPLDVTDLDHDGFKNYADNCPDSYNPKQTDSDDDGADPIVSQPAPHPSVGPVVVYPYTPALPGEQPVPLPTDRDPATGGDQCDNDDDNDGVTDNPRRDNCRLKANPDQSDADFDGVGDACDASDDRPKPAPTDATAPRLTVSMRPTVRLEELGGALPVRVRCSEGCSFQARALRGRSVIARGAAAVESAGTTFLFLRFSESARRSLRRSGGARFTLEVAARDAGGNRDVTRKRLRVLR